MKIPIIAAQDICVAALGGLHHIEVIGIAQRRVIGRIDNYGFRDILQELCVVV